MISRFVAVIDIGKTNAKLAVVDCDDFTEVAVKTVANRVLPGPPYPHVDVDAIWTFLIDGLRAFARDFDIGAISITTHGATGVLLDRAGQLAMPVLDYEHDGPDAVAMQYEDVRPAFAETGAPRLPGGLNLGAQFFWQMTTFPDAAARVATMMMYPQYWAHRLCGFAANDVTSLGCHTDLWNPWEAAFSSLVHKMGWAKLMAPVRASSDVLGPITREIAVETGLPFDTPVLCGIHDSNASLYPHLLSVASPLSVVSSGTWIICMAIDGDGTRPDPHRDTLVNVNALGQPVPSARFMGGREFDALMAGGDTHYTPADVRAVLDRDIMHLPSVERGSGPYPFHDPEWLCAGSMNMAERYVAVSFYLALMTRICLSLCGARGPIAVEGPFARNQPYLMMLQAATGRPVLTSGTSATGTSIGAAMLVKRADGAHVTAQATKPVKPLDGSAARAMRAYATQWLDMVQSE